MESTRERSERIQTSRRVPVADEDEGTGKQTVCHSQVGKQDVVRIFPQLAVRQQSAADESVAENRDGSHPDEHSTGNLPVDRAV